MKITKTIIIIICIAIFIAINRAAFSAIMFDPELKWRSIKTEHFWIHYHQGLEEAANRLTHIAEKVHNRLIDNIRWQPSSRTEVVLVDNRDMANGFAMPVPYNRIQIYISRPALDSLLNNFNDWLELVFTHEYTHILNLDTTNGFSFALNKLFGRWFFPNMFLPIWMIEGNAVYHESAYSIYGRNNSSYTDMVLRTEVFSDNLKSISEASLFPRRWPTGRVPYLYGGQFVEFLEKKYGKGSVADFFIEHSYNFIPYIEQILSYPNHSLITSDQIVYNKTFLNLWYEWQEFLKLKYKKQISIIKKESITNYTQITKSGYRTSLPRFSSDGESIFFVRLTNYNKPVLMRYFLRDHSQSVLCRVNNPNSISTTINGDIFISDAEYYRSFSIFNEAFKYSDGYEILTDRLRGSYIDAAKDSNKVVFVKHDRDKYSIILTNYDFDKYESIIDRSDIQIAYTRFSPDGNRIVFAIKDRKGYSDLAVFDIAKNEISRLTDDEFNDIEPTWHPDGKKIVFSSDINGIYNLYEYNIVNGTISKITNLVGGAFSPDISPDGKTIAFAGYNMKGFDISTMKYPETAAFTKEGNTSLLSHNFFNSKAEKSLPEDKIESGSYSLWNSLFPSFWLPIITSEEIYNNKYQMILGFYTIGTDTLFQHSYMIGCQSYTLEKRAQIEFYYIISKFHPDIIFEYEDATLFYGDDEFPWENKNPYPTNRYISKSGSAAVSIPFNYYNYRHLLFFSYNYQYSKKNSRDYIYTKIMPISYNSSETITVAKFRGVYSFNNTDKYSYSISRENGRVLKLVSDIYNKVIASDLSYIKIRGEYAEYLPGIVRSNVLMLRLRGGASFNYPHLPYNLGRFTKGKTGLPATGEDEFGLRGYPAGNNDIFGKHIITGTIEYRFPILQVDFGLGTFPMMLRDIWLSTFFEYGNVGNNWENTFRIKKFKSSAGIELHTKFTLGYYLNLHGYIGYSRGFNKYGEDQIYFAVSVLFEGALKNNYKWLDYI